jgi:hypothetical protein
MSQYIDFHFNDLVRFQRLANIFAQLKIDKDKNEFRPLEKWPELFDSASLKEFRWLTAAERMQQVHRFSVDLIKRLATQKNTPKQWDFFSMIDAFKDGEYKLIGCDQIAPGMARLEFEAFAYPYGGVGCMVALIESFGFKITAIDDGTGVKKVP